MGDNQFSWAYDGFRKKKWHGGCRDYGTYADAAERSPGAQEGRRGEEGAAVDTRAAAGAVADEGSKDDEGGVEGERDDAGDADDDAVWSTGDVIGCALHITSPAGGRAAGDAEGQEGDQVMVRMAFYRNGRPLGDAFSFDYASEVLQSQSASQSKSALLARVGIYPALSLDSNQQLAVNVGDSPFAYFPADSVEIKVRPF